MQFLLLLLLATSPIQIDGSFSDWDTNVKHQEDSRFIYELIELPRVACLQQLPEQKVVTVGEYTVFFSPKEKGYGVSCKKGDAWISPYDAGIVFAPTTASTTFEIRVDKPDAVPQVRPFSLEPQGDFRVISWNVQFGNLLDDKDRGARILKALKPDVLLIQELDGNDTCEDLEQFLSEVLGGSWNAETNKAHGTKEHHRLLSAIATSSSSLSKVTVGEPPLKAVGANIELDGKSMMFISLHLRCCGGPTGAAEEKRQEEASEIRQALDNLDASHLVIAGDWNLVGTTKPLDIVKAGVLATVEAYQPDGMLNATWSDTTSSFTPGRLDWMLYSQSTLEVIKSFVLDTADLDSDTCKAHDLLPEDTSALSDHLPLVVDFKDIK